MFQEEAIEIEVLDSRKVVAFIKEVEKERIWQATVDLESAGITTVYAFGKTKEKVFAEALAHLDTDIPLIHE